MGGLAFSEQVLMVVLMVLAFIPAIVLHECAHGYAAFKLGDPTAKNAGRLTLNPLAHVDPFGTVVLPGFLILSSVFLGGGGFFFGYAKPVPYNPRYFDDIRKGEVVVGLAGPAANLVMSVIGAGIAWAGNFLYAAMPDLGFYVWYFGMYFCRVNLSLAFFNLIPLPPLDGSSVISLFLSDRAMHMYYKVQQYSMFILLLLIIVIPYVTGIDILGIYLQWTVGSIASLLLP